MVICENEETPRSGYGVRGLFAWCWCYVGMLLEFARVTMLKKKKAYAHLKPGQNGTKGLVEQYGDALLCVRYRFDEVRGMKLKTVEIIVDEKPLRTPRFKDDDLVPVHVAYDEKELRQQLHALQARWNSERKLWYVRFGLIRGTVLEERLAELYA
jgi:hypothetical protein